MSGQVPPAAGRAAGLAAEIARVRRTGEWIDRALFVVAAGALIFTCANVTLFAVIHGTPWFIGWLLDPLTSVALLAVLIGDGALSRHGVRAGAWAAVVKLGTGMATWAMNVWASVAGGDPAAVLLHSIAPGLLIGLAHAAPVYRIGFAAILDRLTAELAAADRPVPTAGPPPGPPGQRGSSPTRTRGPRRGQHRSRRRNPARSLDDLRTQLRAAIDADQIGTQPSAEAIRRLLACAPARARLLRDELTHPPAPARPAGDSTPPPRPATSTSSTGTSTSTSTSTTRTERSAR
jgi:hypothetical protein